MPAAIGISEHNGWAELVTVGIERRAPVVLDRRRAELVGPGLPRNPYHHEALELPLARAERLVEQVRRSVAEHSRAVLSDLQSSHSAGAVSIRESPFAKLPGSLAEVLGSWHLTCAADGMMYREILAKAAAELGMHVDRYPRKSDPMAAAAEAVGVERERVASAIREIGRRLGPPWRKEHALAAASAIRVLARREDVRL